MWEDGTGLMRESEVKRPGDQESKRSVWPKCLGYIGKRNLEVEASPVPDGKRVHG